jgi:hypothetical protein
MKTIFKISNTKFSHDALLYCFMERCLSFGLFEYASSTSNFEWQDVNGWGIRKKLWIMILYQHSLGGTEENQKTLHLDVRIVSI